MSNPGWLDEIFAAVMVAVAVYSTGRLVASRAWSRPTHRDVDLAHVLMGTAMAGMLVSDLNPIPSGAWEVAFSSLAVWFIWRCYKFVSEHGVEGRDEDHVHHLSHYATHLVMASAMVYMYLAAVPAGIGPGGSMAMGAATGTTADFVLLPLLFVVVLFASGIWELDGIGRFSPSRTTGDQLAPAFASVGDGSPSASDTSNGTAEGVDRACAPWLAPRLEAGCHIAMCLTMGYMLILML